MALLLLCLFLEVIAMRRKGMPTEKARPRLISTPLRLWWGNVSLLFPLLLFLFPKIFPRIAITRSIAVRLTKKKQKVLERWSKTCFFGLGTTKADTLTRTRVGRNLFPVIGHQMIRSEELRTSAAGRKNEESFLPYLHRLRGVHG